MIQAIRYGVQAMYAVLLSLTFIFSFRYFMLMVLIITVIGGPFYCGWLCPFGTLQEAVNNISSRYIATRRIPEYLKKWLLPSRYVMYGLVYIGITALFIIDARISFIDMLQGDRLSAVSYAAFALFTAAAAIVHRPFCNWFCVQGAYYGFFSLLRIFRIRRSHTCVSCGMCDRNCPMNIKISDSRQVNSPQCINCFICISRCPKGSLTYGLVSRRQAKAWKTK